MKPGTIYTANTTSIRLAAIFFMLAMVSSLVAQIPKQPNKTDKKGRRQGNWTLAFDAKWQPTTIQDSMAFYRLIAYKDDKPIGLVRDFYISGKKQFEAKLVQDRPQELIDGEATWYYEGGGASKHNNYVSGKREGLETVYYENGKKYAEGTYHNDVVEGRVIYWDEQGAINNIEYYQQGEQVPLQKLWDDAAALFQSNKFAEAEPQLADLYVAVRNKLGPDDDNLSHLLNYWWQAQFKLGKTNAGIKTAMEMCRVREVQKIPKDSVYRDWLYDIVKSLRQMGELDSLESLTKKALAIQLSISPDVNDYYLAYTRTLGAYYMHRNRHNEAEKIYLDNLAKLKMRYSNEPHQYSHEVAGLGIAYENQQRYAEAEKLYAEAIGVYRSKQDTSDNYSTALSRMVGYLIRQGNSPAAIPYALEHVQLQATRKGKKSVEYGKSLFELNESYRYAYKLQECWDVLKEMDALYPLLYPSNSLNYSNLVHQFGLYYTTLGDYDNAEKSFRRELEILAKQTEDVSTIHLTSMSALAEVYTVNKDFVKAELILNEAFELANKIENKNDFSVAVAYRKIGEAQATMENYTEAEASFLQSKTIARRLYGEQHHNYALLLSDWAKVYNETGRARQAIDTLDRVLENLKQNGQEISPSTVTLLRVKALAYNMLEQYDTVIALYEEVVRIEYALFGELHPNYFKSLCQLSSQQAGTHPERAKEIIKTLEAIAQKRGLRKTDVDYETLLTVKWSVASQTNDMAAAVEISREKLAIATAKGKPKEGLVSLGLALFSNNQQKESLQAFQRYFDYVMDDIEKVFPYLSETQKVAFYNSELKYYLDLYYFMALAEPLDMKMGRDSTEQKKANSKSKAIRYIKHPNVANIFNYQLRTKGLLFEANQKMKQSILSSKDERLIALFNQWQMKRAEMNKVLQEADSKQKEEKKSKMDGDIKALEKQLAIKSSFFNQPKASAFTWRDVQKKLKKDEALVEILAISAGIKLRPGKEQNSDYYLAFVITPQTKDYPLCVRINRGDSLENRYLKNYQNSIRFKLTDKYSYEKYWRLLADTLKDVKKIYFSPDGVYHKVNVNTLRNPLTGKFVIEEKEIQFISQARDFVLNGPRGVSIPQDMILFGAPNYNGSPQEVKSNKAKGSLLKKDTTQRFFSGEEITELPGTRDEVTNLKAIAGARQLKVREYLGDEATEDILKTVESPSVLHIATHGFFMPENTVTVGAKTGTRGFANFTSEDLRNPLRRSGLLFSYCKHAFNQEKSTLRLAEDGIFTADEAQNLKLDNTDMVVLSACQTGLGDVKNGEGVYGLQRAFQTAGAKSILMSLWTVSDQATQELMTAFYQQWFMLQNKRDAFRQAQLIIKEKYKDPFYWGAFVLVGD